MKKVMRIISGAIVTACGLSAMVLGGYFALRGNWVWITIIIAGASLVVAGVRLVAGHNLKDILRGLLFVLIRSH